MEKPHASARIPAGWRWIFSLAILLLLGLGLLPWLQDPRPDAPQPDTSSATQQANPEATFPTAQAEPNRREELGTSSKPDSNAQAQQAEPTHAPLVYRIRGNIRPWQSEWTSSAIVEALAADDHLRTERPGMQGTVDNNGEFALNVSSLAVLFLPKRATDVPKRMMVRLSHPQLLPVDREFTTTDFVQVQDPSGGAVFELAIDLRVVSAARIVGQVTDKHSRPASKAQVGVFRGKDAPIPFEMIGFTACDPEGKFELKIPILGDHELLVLHPQHLIHRQAIRVPSFQDVSAGAIALQRGARIDGTIRDVTGKGLYALHVGCQTRRRGFQSRWYGVFPSINWTESGALHHAYDVLVAEDGQFEVEGLEPGLHQILGIRKGNGRTSSDSSLDVLAPASGVQIVLDRPLIQLEVRGAFGPLVQVQVLYRASNNPSPEKMKLSTGDKGIVLFEVEPDLTHEFSFEFPGYISQELVLPSPPVGQIERRVVVLESVAAGSLELNVNAGSTGIRFGSVAATLLRRDTGECIADRTQWSNTTGLFHIPSIPTGEYTLTVDPSGPWNAFESYWSPASAEISIALGKKTTLALELGPCGRIEVLTKPGQSRTDSSWIELLTKEGRYVDLRPDFRTRGGTPLLVQQVEEVWVYGGLRPGEYQVRVFDPELGLIRRELQVQLGQTARANCLAP